MSGGGETRVLLQEAGQESPRMPAWKREILERRKAKGGGSGGAGAAPESSPQKVNGEPSGRNVNGAACPSRDAPSCSGASGRNYTITTANQHFANNKEPWTPGAERATAPRVGGGHESLVLHDSLGPLQENPFIKLEKERKRRQDRENAARPVQHILELYGSVPGIRTIRAENIIIIESDPDYFPEAGGLSPEAKWQQNGVTCYNSLNDLLDRRGSGVTEIRAKEVVIYDTTLSKSEENLSTLGRQDHEAGAYETGEGQGRVSRMLRKFDSNYGKLQKKSHSTENLLDLDCGASSRPRHWAKPDPDLVPKPTSPLRPGASLRSPGSTQPSSPIFQSPWSSRPKPQPAASEPSSPHRPARPPQSFTSYRQRFEVNGGGRDEPDRAQTKPARERDWDGAEVPPISKVPCSPETRHAETPTSPLSSKVSRSSPEFEIRPSPKPDLSLIPDGDTQARALANLRLQSRNSFTVIPKRRLTAPSDADSPVPEKSPPSHRASKVPTPGVPTSHAPTPTPSPSKKMEGKRPEEKEVEKVVRTSKPEPLPPVDPAPPPPPSSDPSPPTSTLTPAAVSPPAPPSPSSPPVSSPPPTPEEPAVDQLPVTNIDDIEVEPPQQVLAPSPGVQRRTGNTFTVVPKRRGEGEGQPGSPEPQQEVVTDAPSGSTPVSTPGSTPPQAPYAHLGSLLKKRYPAVEEIEVIGGYLSLAKSCISKTASTGKKLKISFNESSLQSTYEYPSESSAWDSGEEEEEEEEDEGRKQERQLAEEQPSMVGRIHIPRPSFTSSPAHSTNSHDLSSYVPKHSVDFSTWQEHKHQDAVYQDDANAQQTQTPEDVMLTPADSSSLSDFSSEPALYF
ncbi:taperin [Genypterus blacodes]|uniref:taperin n=1 Tax=Genypterus blacodes TaxID=154954 RepID=UPI003F76AA0B